MLDTLTIGLITKPQGVKGELRVTPLTDDAKRFKSLKSVIIDDKTHTVTSAKVAGDFVILSILGVNDRNTAETFRAKQIKVKREDAVKRDKDSYFIVDIIGLSLVADGQIMGEIIDVTNAHTDIITVKCNNGKIMRFPFLKRVVEKVDIEGGTFNVFKNKLGEVACYED